MNNIEFDKFFVFLSKILKDKHKQSLRPHKQSFDPNAQSLFESDTFDNVLNLFKDKIVPNIVNWGHENFFGFFPLGFSQESLYGHILAYTLQANPFASTTGTLEYDFEQICVKYIADLFGLGIKTGSILGGSSESNLYSICCCLAKYKDAKQKIFVCSDLSHFSIIKSAKLVNVKLVKIPTTPCGVMNYNELVKIFERDKPIYICLTFGTTFFGSIDYNYKILRYLKKYQSTNNLYIHVDGAYAVNFSILDKISLPNFNDLKRAEPFFNSINFSLNKFFGVGANSSVLLCDKKLLKDYFGESIAYIPSSVGDKDFKNYSFFLTHDLRFLKVFFYFKLNDIEEIKRSKTKVLYNCNCFFKWIKAHKNLVKWFGDFRLNYAVLTFKPLIKNAMFNSEFDAFWLTQNVFICTAIINNTKYYRFCFNTNNFESQDQVDKLKKCFEEFVSKTCFSND